MYVRIVTKTIQNGVLYFYFSTDNIQTHFL